MILGNMKSEKVCVVVCQFVLVLLPGCGVLSWGDMDAQAEGWIPSSQNTPFRLVVGGCRSEQAVFPGVM